MRLPDEVRLRYRGITYSMPTVTALVLLCLVGIGLAIWSALALIAHLGARIAVGFHYSYLGRSRAKCGAAKRPIMTYSNDQANQAWPTTKLVTSQPCDITQPIGITRLNNRNYV